MTASAHPLAWPAGRPRTPSHRRTRAKFDTTFALARDELLKELRRLGALSVVLSTNVELRRDGLPLAGQRQPDDPGVAVYFVRNKRQVCFACDRWDKVEHNMRAIAKTIEALRGIERWGTGEMVDAAFTGFAALPAPPPRRKWWEVFGVHPYEPRDQVEAAYRRLAMQHHPDRGGDPARMVEVNAAWDEFRKERGS